MVTSSKGLWGGDFEIKIVYISKKISPIKSKHFGHYGDGQRFELSLKTITVTEGYTLKPLTWVNIQCITNHFDLNDYHIYSRLEQLL